MDGWRATYLRAVRAGDYRLYVALESAYAARVAAVLSRELDRVVPVEPVRAAMRAAMRTGVPLPVLLGLVTHESSWRNVHGARGAIGYVQMQPKYAHDEWPRPLPPDGPARREAMARDVWAQMHAAAVRLRSAWERGEGLRDEEGSTTYQAHAQRHADTLAEKGTPLSHFPPSPVRFVRNPWLAMYNRGYGGGAWPYWPAPNRGDGSNYQIVVESWARRLNAKLGELATAEGGRDPRPDTWSWKT